MVWCLLHRLLYYGLYKQATEGDVQVVSVSYPCQCSSTLFMRQVSYVVLNLPASLNPNLKMNADGPGLAAKIVMLRINPE